MRENQRIGIEIAKAFGIPTDRLMRFDLHFCPNDIVRATCVYAVTDRTGKFEEKVRRFEMVERDQDPLADKTPEERVRIMIEQIAERKKDQLADDVFKICVNGELSRSFDEIFEKIRDGGIQA